jgi:hypothetical protein
MPRGRATIVVMNEAIWCVAYGLLWWLLLMTADGAQ